MMIYAKKTHFVGVKYVDLFFSLGIYHIGDLNQLAFVDSRFSFIYVNKAIYLMERVTELGVHSTYCTATDNF